MGKMRFGPARDQSLKDVRSADAIIQYIDRVVEIPVPVEIVRTVQSAPVPVYIDREKIVEVIKEIEKEKIVYVDRLIEVPVIVKADEMEIKELVSNFERHQDFSSQSINKQQLEINQIKLEIIKQQRMFFVYGAISGIVTVLGFIFTR